MKSWTRWSATLGLLAAVGLAPPTARAQVATCADAWACAGECAGDDACIAACMSDLTGDEASYAQDLAYCISELCVDLATPEEQAACLCNECGGELYQCLGYDPCQGEAPPPAGGSEQPPGATSGESGTPVEGGTAAPGANPGDTCAAYVGCASQCADNDDACFGDCADQLPGGAQTAASWWTGCGENCALSASTEAEFEACLCAACADLSAACFGLQCGQGGTNAGSGSTPGGGASGSGGGSTGGSAGRGGAGSSSAPSGSGSASASGSGGASTSGSAGGSDSGESCAKLKAFGGVFKNVKVCGTPVAGGASGGEGCAAAGGTPFRPALPLTVLALAALAAARRRRRAVHG